MAKKETRPTTVETLRANLKMLMKLWDNMDNKTLSEKSGVSKRHVDYILDGRRDPSIEIAEKLAEVFGLSGWQLIMPHLDESLAKDEGFRTLMEKYAKMSPEGRQYINIIVDRDKAV